MKPMDLMEALGNVPDELKAAALSDEAGTHPASAAAAPVQAAESDAKPHGFLTGRIAGIAALAACAAVVIGAAAVIGHLNGQTRPALTASNAMESEIEPAENAAPDGTEVTPDCAERNPALTASGPEEATDCQTTTGPEDFADFQTTTGPEDAYTNPDNGEIPAEATGKSGPEETTRRGYHTVYTAPTASTETTAALREPNEQMLKNAEILKNKANRCTKSEISRSYSLETLVSAIGTFDGGPNDLCPLYDLDEKCPMECLVNPRTLQTDNYNEGAPYCIYRTAGGGYLYVFFSPYMSGLYSTGWYGLYPVTAYFWVPEDGLLPEDALTSLRPGMTLADAEAADPGVSRIHALRADLLVSRKISVHMVQGGTVVIWYDGPDFDASADARAALGHWPPRSGDYNPADYVIRALKFIPEGQDIPVGYCPFSGRWAGYIEELRDCDR